MNNITKAVRSSLDLDGTSLDCYMLPDGEKRIGITGASEVIGRSDVHRPVVPVNKKIPECYGVGRSGDCNTKEKAMS